MKCLDIAEPRIFCPPKITRYTRFTSVGRSRFIATICSLYMQAYKSVVITIFLLLIRVCEEEVKARMGLVECINHNLVEPYHHLRETR